IQPINDPTTPVLTPNHANSIPMRTATSVANQPGSGAGEVNAGAAVNAVNDLLGMLSPANGGLVRSTGTGSLEASRGSLHVYADTNDDGAPDPVRGEVTAFGTPWTSQSWSTNSWSGYACGATSWSDASWGAKSWSGMQWDAKGWPGNAG